MGFFWLIRNPFILSFQLKYKRYKFKEDSLHLYIQIIEVLLNKNTMENKLKIQIWSDIMCPYCYIEKRRIEGALEQFEHKAAVEIEKSFQLDFVASEDDDMVEHSNKIPKKKTKNGHKK
jgi:hypothetical protein